MNRIIGILILAVFFLHIQAAHAENVKDALNHKYKNHILALRSPFTARDQKFDSAGQPWNARPTGHWLLYGGIFVEKLNLSPDTLRLEGHRAASYLDKKNGRVMLVRYDKARRIEIHLDQSLNSLEDAQTVLNRVFFLEAMPLSMPSLNSVAPMTTLQPLRSTTSEKTVSWPPEPHIPLSPSFPSKLATPSIRELWF